MKSIFYIRDLFRSYIQSMETTNFFAFSLDTLLTVNETFETLTETLPEIMEKREVFSDKFKSNF